MRWTLAILLVAVILGIALGVGLTWAELGPYSQAPAQLALDGAGRLLDPSKPLPRAELVGSDTFNFGSMEHDAKGTHSFEIKNTGDAPLSLAKGSTTCKCTLSNLENDSVKPGESAKVELEWTASGVESDFRHSASIRTSDPRRPYITLTIEGRVSRSHKVVPQDLRFSSISVGEGATAELLLYAYETENLNIARHEFADTATAEYFDLRIEEMPADDVAKAEDAKAGRVAVISIKPGLPLGPFRQRIRLWLELPGDPIVEVPVEGFVIGDISILGPRTGRGAWDSEQNLLVLGNVKSEDGGQSQGMHLLVKGEHREELDLKVAEVRPDFVQVEFDKPQPVAGENVTKIPFTIKIPPGAPPGDHSGAIGKAARIDLDTGHPTTPRLRLYVTFAVER